MDALPQIPGRPCSMASALQLVGERWSLLAIREILLGNRRFDEIARNTGAPRDRIAVRLKALQAAGVVERRQYQDRPARFEYFLTPAGRELQPVLQALMLWGDRWAREDRPLVLEHDCGHELDPAWTCRHCGREIRSRDLTQKVQDPGWTLAGPASGSAGSAGSAGSVAGSAGSIAGSAGSIAGSAGSIAGSAGSVASSAAR